MPSLEGPPRTRSPRHSNDHLPGISAARTATSAHCSSQLCRDRSVRSAYGRWHGRVLILGKLVQRTITAEPGDVARQRFARLDTRSQRAAGFVVAEISESRSSMSAAPPPAAASRPKCSHRRVRRLHQSRVVDASNDGIRARHPGMARGDAAAGLARRRTRASVSTSNARGVGRAVAPPRARTKPDDPAVPGSERSLSNVAGCPERPRTARAWPAPSKMPSSEVDRGRHVLDGDRRPAWRRPLRPSNGCVANCARMLASSVVPDRPRPRTMRCCCRVSRACRRTD